MRELLKKFLIGIAFFTVPQVSAENYKVMVIPDNVVTEKALAKVIEVWTGIPASKVEESDYQKLLDLSERLSSKIIGQDEAIGLITAAVKRSRVKTSSERRPASFIFVGPTGVGKTKLV